LRARIGEWEFDHSKYDPDADVLYLTIGPPQDGYGEETPEGHFLRFNDDGEFCGVTILDAKRIWEEEGRLCITVAIPKKIELPEGQFQLA
jgi:uncharacterized protein YuzE